MKPGRPNLESGAAWRSFPWVGGMIIHFIYVYCKRFLAGILRSSKMPQRLSIPERKMDEKQFRALVTTSTPDPWFPLGRHTVVLLVT